MSEVKHLALDQVFFWEKMRKATFFVQEIVPFLHDTDFKAAVDNEFKFIPANWEQLTLSGLLPAMNAYRNSINRNPYPAGNHSYVLFVSGAYTHEEEMREKGQIPSTLEVDTVITTFTPELCLELVRVVKDLKRKRGFGV